MSLSVHPAPRLVALVAWALAFTVASGASSPRLRAPGRERVARAGMVRTGSQRPDDPRAWVAPGTEHDPEYTVADAVVASTTGETDAWRRQAPSFTLAAARFTADVPSASPSSNRTAPRPRLIGWLVGPAHGRAPPLA